MLSTTLTILLGAVVLAPQKGLALQSMPQKKILPTQLRSAVMEPMWAMPSDMDGDIRNVLDEAVMMFQASMDQGSSTDEAESVVCEVGRILHETTNNRNNNNNNNNNNDAIVVSTNDGGICTRQEVCQQLDQAVMNAAKDPSLLAQVEVLAIEYHRLLQTDDGTSSSTTATNNNSRKEGQRNSNVLNQLILSESQLRLKKLKQSLMIVEDAPILSSEVTSSVKSVARAEIAVEKVEPSLFAASKETSATIATTLTTQLSSESVDAVENAAPSVSVASDVKSAASATISAAQDAIESPEPPPDDQKVASSSLNKKDDSLVESAIKKSPNTNDEKVDNVVDADEVDIAIVGAGIGGLCAGAILNTLYGKKVGIYESHYLAGGCAHAFDRVAPNGMTFTFDSGPTIVLGCSRAPYNPLRQVLDAVGQSVEWIEYKGWGMIENPGKESELRWKVELGEDVFQEGPIKQFGSDIALQEFEDLRKATQGLVSGAVGIPAMAMRAGKSALIPLLRYLPALFDIIKQGEELTTGTFAAYMDGPIFTVSDPWLRSWLDALAFSLSGLPASRTSAAAMAYVLFDMHRPNAALDYPRGGLGSVIDALVSGVEQGDNGSKVNLRSHVESIDASLDGARITGLTLRSGKRVKARDGVISNVPVWSLNNLIKNPKVREVLDNFSQKGKKRQPRKSWVNRNGVNFIPREREPVEDIEEESLLNKCDTSEMTGSFLHLHLAIRADGLNLKEMEAHYTVMDRSLAGDGSENDGPCGELNMIAVSNPCVIDDTLAPDGFMVVHAYGAGNEPFELWNDVKRGSVEYNELKEKRSEVLWRAVESIIPDVRERVVLDMVGSPITHERFLRRPMGTYGAATEDYLKDGSTPFETLVLAGDSVFPGIGVPAVALSGASAANAMVSPFKQWNILDQLKRRNVI